MNHISLKGDLDQGTFHLGYFYENKIEGVLSVMKTVKLHNLEEWQFLGKIARIGSWQKLIAFAEDILEAEKITKIWLNAREKAVPFTKMWL